MADDWCYLSFNISETRHVTKNLTTDITIALKILIKNPKENILLPCPYYYGNFQYTV